MLLDTSAMPGSYCTMDIADDPRTQRFTTISICSYTQGGPGQLQFGWACLDLSWEDWFQDADEIERGFRLWMGFSAAPRAFVLGPRIQRQQTPRACFTQSESPMCRTQVSLHRPMKGLPPPASLLLASCAQSQSHSQGHIVREGNGLHPHEIRGWNKNTWKSNPDYQNVD